MDLEVDTTSKWVTQFARRKASLMPCRSLKVPQNRLGKCQTKLCFPLLIGPLSLNWIFLAVTQVETFLCQLGFCWNVLWLGLSGNKSFVASSFLESLKLLPWQWTGSKQVISVTGNYDEVIMPCSLYRMVPVRNKAVRSENWFSRARHWNHYWF